MKEIGILYSAPMVAAKIAGAKTQTRRVLKGTPRRWIEDAGFNPDFVAHADNRFCPYGYPSDLHYVRETFYAWGKWDKKRLDDGTVKNTFIDLTEQSGMPYLYTPPERVCTGRMGLGYHKRPGLFMPKVAARIWEEVVSVRVERLNDISANDAIAEGILSYTDTLTGTVRYKDYMADASGYGDHQHDYPCVHDPITSYRTLWESVSGPGSLEANQWVWVIETKTLSITGRP